ncbi:MAG TPA: hypothetical protein VIC04_10780, partial [Terriglobia bacterium]
RGVICTEDAAEAVIMEGTVRKVRTPLKEVRSLYQRKYKWDFCSLPNNRLYVIRPSVVFAFAEMKGIEVNTRWHFPA